MLAVVAWALMGLTSVALADDQWPDAVPAAPAADPIAASENLLVHPSLYSARNLDWTDAARGRNVPARLYLPTRHSDATGTPLVVFSHGIGGSREGYSYLGRFFAANGYASLHVQHVGSDRQVWSGNPLLLVSRLSGAAQESEALNRAQDMRYALDQLLASPDGATIDMRRIAAAGHSYGANTAMLIAGARLDGPTSRQSLRDPRISAAILLSAPPFYGETDTARILAGIRVPTLHITATGDVIRIPGYYSGAEDRIAVYDAISGAPKILAVFEGGSHSMFTDRAGTGGVGLNPQVKNATRELALAFMKSVFESEGSGLVAWPERFAGILARFAASER